MIRYRIAYLINDELKTKNINAMNYKSLKNKLRKKYRFQKSFAFIGYTELYKFKYGIYNSMSKKFEFGIKGESPNEVNKKLFKKIGQNSRKLRYEAKPIEISKEEQKHVMNQIRVFDKEMHEIMEQNNEYLKSWNILIT